MQTKSTVEVWQRRIAFICLFKEKGKFYVPMFKEVTALPDDADRFSRWHDGYANFNSGCTRFATATTRFG